MDVSITQWGKMTRQCSCGLVVSLLGCSGVRYILIAMITRGIVKDYTMTTTFERILMQVRRKLHLLTPWCRVLLERVTGLQLVKKFPAFYGTQRFITALTSVRHLSLSWASPVQSTQCVCVCVCVDSY